MSKKSKWFGKWPIPPELENPFAVACTLQEEYAKNETGYRTALYTQMATAAHVAIEFDRDAKAWQRFTKHPFWDGQKARPRPIKVTRSKLKFVVEFITKAASKLEKRRAWKFCRGLRYLLDTGTPINKIPGKIADAGGLEKLCRLAAKMDPRRSKSEGDDDYVTGQGKYALKGEKDEPLRGVPANDDVPGEKAQPPSSRSKGRSADGVIRSKAAGLGETGAYSVEFAPKAAKVSRRLEVGQRARATMKRLPDGRGNIFKVVRLKPIKARKSRK